jgi:hypothetical protein
VITETVTKRRRNMAPPSRACLPVLLTIAREVRDVEKLNYAGRGQTVYSRPRQSAVLYLPDQLNGRPRRHQQIFSPSGRQALAMPERSSRQRSRGTVDGGPTPTAQHPGRHGLGKRAGLERHTSARHPGLRPARRAPSLHVDQIGARCTATRASTVPRASSARFRRRALLRAGPSGAPFPGPLEVAAPRRAVLLRDHNPKRPRARGLSRARGRGRPCALHLRSPARGAPRRAARSPRRPARLPPICPCTYHARPVLLQTPHEPGEQTG